MALSPWQVSPAKLYSAAPPGKKAGLEVVLLEALLDLVDRYWGGCKSLHGNEVFRGESGGRSAQTHTWATLRAAFCLQVLFACWVLSPAPCWTLPIGRHRPCRTAWSILTPS